MSGSCYLLPGACCWVRIGRMRLLLLVPALTAHSYMPKASCCGLICVCQCVGGFLPVKAKQIWVSSDLVTCSCMPRHIAALCQGNSSTLCRANLGSISIVMLLCPHHPAACTSKAVLVPPHWVCMGPILAHLLPSQPAFYLSDASLSTASLKHDSQHAAFVNAQSHQADITAFARWAIGGRGM